MKAWILAAAFVALSLSAQADESIACDSPEASIGHLRALGVAESDITVLRDDGAQRLLKGINQTGEPTDYTASALVVVKVDADRVAGSWTTSAA